MILTGEEIKKEVAAGHIEIDPYNEDNVQPVSVDLTLGEQARVYTSQVTWDEGANSRPGESLHHGFYQPLDPKEEQETQVFIMPITGFVLRPDILYLMHTRERIHAKEFVSVLDGKSSIGRLGVVIHLTAGYGDPGFDGQYTLEVTCVHPVILYPGMKIAQMRFHTVRGAITDYGQKGHYKGETAAGAVASMAHAQFEEND